MFRFGFLKKENNSETRILPLDFYYRKAKERIILGIGRHSTKREVPYPTQSTSQYALSYYTFSVERYSRNIVAISTEYMNFTVN